MELRELFLHGCRLPSDYNQFTALTQLSKLKIIGCELPVVVLVGVLLYTFIYFSDLFF